MPYEICLIDNGSRRPFKPTRKPLHYRQVRVFPNCGNIGGINRCFENTTSPLVLFISNDVRLWRGCVRELVKFSDRCERWAQIQPTIYDPRGNIDNTGMDWIYPGFGVSRKQLSNGEVQIVPSIVFLMRRGAWEAMNGFDEKLISSHEDVDMGLRLERRGYKNYVSFNAVATHLGNQTLSKTITRPSDTFRRARELVVKKHYNCGDKLLRLALIRLVIFFRSVYVRFLDIF